MWVKFRKFHTTEENLLTLKTNNFFRQIVVVFFHNVFFRIISNFDGIRGAIIFFALKTSSKIDEKNTFFQTQPFLKNEFSVKFT